MGILPPSFGLIPDRVMFPAVVFLALQASVALASPLEDQDRFFDLCEKITAISTKNGKGWIHPIKDWICGTTTTVPTTTTTTETMPTTSVAPPSSVSCFAIGVHAKQAGMNDWCHLNCNHVPAYCPPTPLPLHRQQRLGPWNYRPHQGLDLRNNHHHHHHDHHDHPDYHAALDLRPCRPAGIIQEPWDISHYRVKL